MTSNSAMRFIHRVGDGWNVKRKNRENSFCQYFADSKHGGKRKALVAAQEWRDEQERIATEPMPSASPAGRRPAQRSAVCAFNGCPRHGKPFPVRGASEAPECCSTSCASKLRFQRRALIEQLACDIPAGLMEGKVKSLSNELADRLAAMYRSGFLAGVSVGRRLAREGKL